VFDIPNDTLDLGAQVLVTVWDTGRVTLAVRPHRNAAWGAPVRGAKA
jgi:hypothetical protein